MKKKILFMISTCISLLFFSIPSFAEVSIADMIAEIQQTLEDRLNLTSEQRTLIDAEISNQKIQRKTYADQEKAKKQAIEEEMAKDVVDVATVDALTTELNLIREDVLILRKNTTKNIKEVLTDDQLVVLDAIKQDQLDKLKDDDGYDEGGDDGDDSDDGGDTGTASIKVYSIMCPTEDDLPNWSVGADKGMNKTMLDGFIAASDGCEYSSGWSFQYGNQYAPIYASNYYGEAAGYLETFGPTVGAEGVVVSGIDISTISQFRIRIVWKNGYYHFSGVNYDTKSSEFYCVDNSLGFNNKETIDNPTAGSYYTCVLLTTAD